MTNATIARTTTASNAPRAKLYKMCQWGHHAQCKGAFETTSVCNCACHKTPAAPKARKAVKAAPAKTRTAAAKRYSTPAAPAAQVFSKAEIEANIAQLCAMVRNLRALPTA